MQPGVLTDLLERGEPALPDSGRVVLLNIREGNDGAQRLAASLDHDPLAGGGLVQVPADLRSQLQRADGLHRRIIAP